jgi:hypothetical protein
MPLDVAAPRTPGALRSDSSSVVERGRLLDRVLACNALERQPADPVESRGRRAAAQQALRQQSGADQQDRRQRQLPRRPAY